MTNERNHLIDDEVLDRLDPSASRELLRLALVDQRPPDGRRIFVNRTLRMEKIRHIGFDLDWTLADYDQEAMTQLAFERTLDRLVERFGYPKAILGAEFRSDFSRRGLMLDTAAGTVLKMNRHRYVGRAYSGRKFLDADARAELYRREPINPGSNRFYCVDTLFELPEVNIFSEIIDLARRRPQAVSPSSYSQLFEDVHRAVDSIHADGTLKRHILADLPRYLPRDPRLILALKRMALGQRRLMLITNSEWFYTEGLSSHLFDGSFPGLSSWRDLFDLIVVSAGKPGFFRKRSPFVELDESGREGGEVEVPRWGGVYAGGSREGLMKLLDCPGEQVLYVGDHIYGDILSSKLTSTWRTALVVRELEEELSTRRSFTSQLRHLDVLRAEFIDLGLRMDDLRDMLELYRAATRHVDELADADAFRSIQELLGTVRAEHRLMRQHANRLQRLVSRAINPYWGSLFKQGSSKSFFGSQVDDFACVYTSRVSNFAYYGSNHYHRVLRDSMMHEAEV